ncbi:DNA topoisomerase 3 [Yarrowia sp. C11]|nr:DNA topoisomerase 3 [Yarrowia sp. C11]KAG5364268.1 DNA topoisomerase 3 [Yarrowia sp. E02]
MKVLCVAEKPSVAKAVCNILGGGYTTRQTGDQYLRNYDFQYDFPGWGVCDCTMTSVRGHLTDSEFVSKEAQKFHFNPARLFSEPITTQVKNDLRKCARNIENEARHARKLLIWTDCDREGEYIGWEIVQEAIKKNPNIEVRRAVFSDLERSHVIHAARNLQQLDMNAVNAVAARMEIDYRTGFAFTRLQTLHVQKKFANLKDSIISYGSCQFPTLGFIVDRYLARENFVPEPFWYMTLKCRVSRKQMNLKSKRGHIFDRASAVALYARVCESGVLPKVTNLSSRPTSKYRPLPLTTVELLKLGSKALKLPSKTVLQLAENLYQESFISYPRTETDQFSDDMDLKPLLAKQKNSPIWGDYAGTLVDGDAFSTPRKGRHNDKAHPPIHPIAHCANFKTNDHKRVYELIARHFMACCSKDAKGQQSTVDVDWHGEKFTATGLVILETNFLDIYPYVQWTGSGELPAGLEVGKELPIVESMLAEGNTTPPKLLTEPELLALMDMNGIGTDATMAEHISTVVNREYVHRCNAQGRQVQRGKAEYFTPSPLGQALVEGYDSIGLDRSLTKPFIRRDLETQLSQVAKGEASKDVVVESALISFKDMFDLTKREIVKLERAIRQRVV